MPGSYAKPLKRKRLTGGCRALTLDKEGVFANARKGGGGELPYYSGNGRYKRGKAY